MGKSALLKRFWHELRGPGIQVYYLHLAHLSSSDLLRLLVRTLGETPLWSKDQLLGQIRDRAQQTDGTLLVLLDEAHLLKAETLTDLRLLVSSALDDQPPLKLVLAGQPPLLELLRRHRDVLDRISVRYHLHPLSKPQTAAYLDFHVRTAGGTDALIDPTEIAGFSNSRAVTTRNDEPERASRPFDRDRYGFVLSEGAAVAVVESLDHARTASRPTSRPSGPSSTPRPAPPRTCSRPSTERPQGPRPRVARPGAVVR